MIYRNPQIDDVVLVHYARKVGKGDYRLARVHQVHPDEHGTVRTVTVAMRPRDIREKVSKDPPYLQPKGPLYLPLGVQRICVILPKEEQDQKPNQDPNEDYQSVDGGDSKIESDF